MSTTKSTIEITATLEGVTPITQGKIIDPLEFPKEKGEMHDVYEERIWKERAHKTEDGQIFIPGVAFYHSMIASCKMLGETVKGKGKATYTKHITCGLIGFEDIHLDINITQVKPTRVSVPSDGRAGGTTRVWKKFPTIPRGWVGELKFIAVDPVLTSDPERIQKYLEDAGRFIGVGTWRPQTRGQNGRWVVKEFKVA